MGAEIGSFLGCCCVVGCFAFDCCVLGGAGMRGVTITYVGVSMLFAWTLDISVSALINGLVLTNGFWLVSPIKMYHVSLWGWVLITFLFAFWNDHLASRKYAYRWDE